MTYAPADLKQIQRYLRERTGLPWASIGLTHQVPEGGGYHEGRDLLHAANKCPDCPGGDYSYTESIRDRRGLTDAASGLDLGDFDVVYKGVRRTRRDLTRFLLARFDDPRARDIREIIYSLDGVTVRRRDREGRRTNGDKSHTSHDHYSLYRDSEGRRARLDNVLGLFMEFFGDLPAPAPTTLEDDDMTPEQAENLKAMDNRIRDALVKGVETMRDIPGEGPAVPVWIVRTLNAHGLLLAQLTKSLQELTGADLVDEQAIVDGVLSGLGTQPVVEIAEALRATGIDVKALAEALTAPR